MPGPDPHAAGSTRSSQWWVISRPSGQRGGGPQLMVTQATNRPQNAVAGPFASQAAAEKKLTALQNQGSFPSVSIPNPVSIVGGWFSSLGADIGSGIESGLVYILKDLWNVIIGPVEVGLGLVIAVIAIFLWLGGDMSSAIALVK